MKEQRRKSMASLIAQKKNVSMQELCSTFDVSMNTVRADISYLVQIGAIEKVYGGVQATVQPEVPIFDKRAIMSSDVKKRIAHRAQQEIVDSDIVFIDSGTTTMHMIDYLDPSLRVTIATGNLYVIQRAPRLPLVDLVVVPGLIDRRINSISDGSTVEYLKQFRFNKVFMGATGISSDGRLSVSSYSERDIKRCATSRCDRSYLLMDAAKFEKNGFMSYGSVQDMAEIISDESCSEAMRTLCAAGGVKLTLV